MRFRFRAPLAANPRMKNLFESALFCRVAEYYGAKFVSIQVPGVRENFPAKFATNFFLLPGQDRQVGAQLDPHRKIWPRERSRADIRKSWSYL